VAAWLDGLAPGFTRSHRRIGRRRCWERNSHLSAADGRGRGTGHSAGLFDQYRFPHRIYVGSAWSIWHLPAGAPGLVAERFEDNLDWRIGSGLYRGDCSGLRQLALGLLPAGAGQFLVCLGQCHDNGTSLRFERPRLTLNWWITFPTGIIMLQIVGISREVQCLSKRHA